MTRPRTVTGSVTSGNFCGYLSPAGRRSYYTLHFVAMFDRPFTTVGTWENDVVRPEIHGRHRAARSYGTDGYPPAGRGSGAYVGFAPGSYGDASASGISYVSLANARANLAAEQPGGMTIERVQRAARKAWNTMLGRIADHRRHRERAAQSSTPRSITRCCT